MTETIEDMEKFVKERKAYFKENIFPIMDAIAKAIFDSKKLNKNCLWDIKRKIVYKGVRIYFEGHINIKSKHNTYHMTVKYGLFGSKKVLEYHSYNSNPVVFHECGWIENLNGLVEKIQQEDVVWKKKQALKRYKQMCKDLSKKECNND